MTRNNVDRPIIAVARQEPDFSCWMGENAWTSVTNIQRRECESDNAFPADALSRQVPLHYQTNTEGHAIRIQKPTSISFALLYGYLYVTLKTVAFWYWFGRINLCVQNGEMIHMCTTWSSCTKVLIMFIVVNHLPFFFNVSVLQLFVESGYHFEG